MTMLDGVKSSVIHDYTDFLLGNVVSQVKNEKFIGGAFVS